MSQTPFSYEAPSDLRHSICQLALAIKPFDELERQHIHFTQKWINSGAEIFRTNKQDVPDPHLVTYFVPLDSKNKKLLLTDHKKAELWLPPGGHMEGGEHPQETVRREAMEELSLEAHFILPHPFFLTISQTSGKTHQHNDISLWYLLFADSTTPLEYDQGEFNRIQWFSFKDIPYQNSDRHMDRFIKKLQNSLP